MNKKLFLLIIFFLALGITLGAVYYLNIASIKNSPATNTSSREENKDTAVKNENNPEMDTAVRNSNIVVDENTPKNYNNAELINMEKEINSLDLSGENDLQ